MYNKNFFKDVYDDFFGVEKIKEENEKLKKELNLTDDFPVIEVKKEDKDKNLSSFDKSNSTIENENVNVDDKVSKDKKIAYFFEMLESLYIEDDSKNIIKKIIEYMRKYNEKIEKEYIPFNLCLCIKDEITLKKVIELLKESAIYFSYIDKNSSCEFSLYDLKEIDEFTDTYLKNGMLLLKKFEGLEYQDLKFRDSFWNKLENLVINSKKMLLLKFDSKEDKSRVFEKYSSLKERIFDLEIIETVPKIQDIYNEVEKRLSKNNSLDDSFKIALLEFIQNTYVESEYSYSQYIELLCKKILFNKSGNLKPQDLPTYNKEKSMDEIFEELNSLVGLKKVKEVLNDLVSLIELKNKSKGSLNIKDTNLHMVFLGNPGTGKTTVARIIAKILYNLKYIKQDKLIEVSSKDLVAEYVGQTAPKTMEVVKRAMGGVLFIDEAYSLASGNGTSNGYNEEAVATLIQAMENYRDNLVVIFAGYTKEMQNFLNLNSGIVSRIGYTLEFDDYSTEELIQIFESMTKKAGFDVTKKAILKVKSIIEEYKNTKNFGNARFIRNLYEKSVIKHAANTKGIKNKKIIKTIDEDDISVENLLKM